MIHNVPPIQATGENCFDLGQVTLRLRRNMRPVGASAKTTVILDLGQWVQQKAVRLVKVAG